MEVDDTDGDEGKETEADGDKETGGDAGQEAAEPEKKNRAGGAVFCVLKQRTQSISGREFMRLNCRGGYSPVLLGRDRSPGWPEGTGDAAAEPLFARIEEKSTGKETIPEFPY